MLIGLDKYRSLLSEKIPEISASIILYGKDKIGKFSFIRNESNVHVIKLNNDKKIIGVEQVRQVMDEINVMPYSDSRHYVVIDDAELNMEFMALLSNRPEVRKAHDEINRGMVNKNVVIDVLLYMLIKYNLGDNDGG